jgi:hypothetical protein
MLTMRKDNASVPRGRVTFAAVAAAIVALAVTTSTALATQKGSQDRDEAQQRENDNREHDNEREPYAIGLWGDLPYSDLQATVGVPNLIADMNRQHVAFSVHDGDLKTGNGAPTCNDAIYLRGLGYLNSLDAPAMFTPGDNDWTDCDRPNNGTFNSLERLTHERQVFFNTPFSLGRHRLRQDVQSEPLCLGVTDPVSLKKVLMRCVENRRWTLGGVTYATLNIQGSCNNLCGDGPDVEEYTARNRANIAWMQATFEEAKTRRSAAVMIISQADPGFSQSEFDAPQREPISLAQTDGNPDGFQEFLLALREQVIAFSKPVAYVHGDSHYFRIDKPLLDAPGGRRIQNFTRIETFGDHAEADNADVQWVKVLIDTRSPEVFAYQPQVVPGNVPTIASR